jgi:hypothetical protein
MEIVAFFVRSARSILSLRFVFPSSSNRTNGELRAPRGPARRLPPHRPGRRPLAKSGHDNGRAQPAADVVLCSAGRRLISLAPARRARVVPRRAHRGASCCRLALLPEQHGHHPQSRPSIIDGHHSARDIAVARVIRVRLIGRSPHTHALGRPAARCGNCSHRL